MYIERLEKARREEEIKKNRVTANLSKISEKKWNKNAPRYYLKSRASSMENTIILTEAKTLNNYKNMHLPVVKKTLHQELHNWNDER
jgi:hypothetical protein